MPENPRPRLGGPKGLLLASAMLVATVAVTVAGCGTTPQGGGPMLPSAADSNVPTPPNVDRSKCDDKGKQVITADTNQDKKPDVWKFFATTTLNGQQVQALSCKQVDLNHDGKIDIVYFYDDRGAQTTLEEFDLDFDGKFDLTVYYVQGKKVREELDTNYDQRPDLWKYFEDEKLVRIERDTNNDGKVDEWQYFEGGKLDRIGYDTTGSGRVDRWDRAPEADDNGGATGGEAAPAGGATTPPPASTTPPPASGAATPAKPAPKAAEKKK